MISPTEIQSHPTSLNTLNHKANTNNNDINNKCVKKKKRKKFELTVVDDFAFLAFKSEDDLEQQEHDESQVKTTTPKKGKNCLKPKTNSKTKSSCKSKSTSSSTSSNNDDNNHKKKIKLKKNSATSPQSSSKNKCNGSKSSDKSLAKALEAKELAERRLSKLQEKFKAEQNKNRTLEERLRESQMAAEAAEKKQNELSSMTRRLVESTGLKYEEKQKLEEDIKIKKEEVARAWEKANVMKENAHRASSSNNDLTIQKRKENNIRTEKAQSKSSSTSNTNASTNDVSNNYDNGPRIEQKQIHNPLPKQLPSSNQYMHYNRDSFDSVGKPNINCQASYSYINDNNNIPCGNLGRQPSATERLHQMTNGLMQNDLNRNLSATPKQYCQSPIQQTPQLHRPNSTKQYYPPAPPPPHPSQTLPMSRNSSCFTMQNPYACPPLPPPPSFMINETISRQTSIIPSMSALESSMSNSRYMHHPGVEQSLQQMTTHYDPNSQHHASMYYPALQDRNFIESRLHSSHHLGPHSISTHQMVQSVPMPTSMAALPPPPPRPPIGSYPMMSPYASSSNSVTSSTLNPYFDRWYETQRAAALTRTYTNLYQSTAPLPTGYPHTNPRPAPFPQGIFPPPF